ncbi:MAG: class I SAM-dependent methyltransferase [bacterium]
MNPAAFTGSIPENYEKYLGPLLFEPYALDLTERINIKGVISVLEIACGTGRLTKHLRKLLPADVKLIATDLNEAMIDTSKKFIGDEGINFQPADAQELPFEDDSFDLVVCQFGIMFFPDKQKALSEIHRVLRKDGCFLFNTWDKIENNQLTHTANTIVTEFFDNDPPVFYQTPFSMHDTDAIKKLLEDSSFREIEITKVKKEGVSPSSEDAVKGLLYGNPIHMEIESKNPEALGKIKKEIQSEIVKRFGDHPVVTKLNAIVCKGIK